MLGEGLDGITAVSEADARFTDSSDGGLTRGLAAQPRAGGLAARSLDGRFLNAHDRSFPADSLSNWRS